MKKRVSFRILAVVLSIFLCFTYVHSNTKEYSAMNVVKAEEQAEDNMGEPNIVVEGTDGGVTWTLNSDGYLEVNVTGDLSYVPGDDRETDTYNNWPWFQYRELIKTASVEGGDFTYANDMFSACSKLTEIDVSGLDTSNVTDMSKMFYGCASLLSLDISNFNTSSVTDMHYIFAGCNSLTNVNLTGINTSNVTDMSSMFEECNSLLSLDLSNFDTSKVTDMSYMFYECDLLTTLDLSSFDTSKVTNMHSMFCCIHGGPKMSRDGNSLSSIIISNFETGSVTDMLGMFCGCALLNSLDLSNFDTKNVKTMESMFWDCRSLKELDLSNFDTKKVTDMSYMFANCKSLESLDLSGFDLSNVINSKNMFNVCDMLDTIKTPNKLPTGDMISLPATYLNKAGIERTRILDTNDIYTKVIKHTLTFDVNGGKAISEKSRIVYENKPIGKLPVCERDNYTFDGWFTQKNGGDKIVSTDKLTTDLTVYAHWTSVEDIIASGQDGGVWWRLYSDGYLEIKITGDLPYVPENRYNFDTHNYENCWPWRKYYTSIKTAKVSGTGLTNARYMFEGCNYLTSVDVNDFDTRLVTDMSNMFSQCWKLEEVDVSKFDTSNVISFSGLFMSCHALKVIEVSGFDTSKATNMSYMFSGCSSVAVIDLKSFDTVNVDNMAGMFSGCKSLTQLDVSGFDTGNVTTMESMFSNCTSLKRLDLSSFNTSNVKEMAWMFLDCSALTEVNLSSFNTSNVIDMPIMFQGCSSLTSLDLSSFDMSKVVSYTNNILQDCTSLKVIKTPKKLPPKEIYDVIEGKTVDNRILLPDTYLNKSGDIRTQILDTNDIYTKAIKHTLSFDVNGGKAISEKSRIVYENKPIGKLPVCERDNYTFDGWFTKKSGGDEITATDTLTSNLTVYAHWSKTEDISVTGVKLNISKAAMQKGDSLVLKATVTPRDATLKTVIWSSSNKKIASVDKNGTVKALSKGNATITVTTVDGAFTSKCVITVIDNDADPDDPDKPTTASVTMYRLYNPNSGEHFYTASQSEINNIVAAGWKNEGVAWKAPKTSKTPVYRLYNPNAGDHHYTTSAAEKDSLVSVGWKYEGIGWYSDDNKGIALHRLYNPNAQAGSHHYTTSVAEKDNLVTVGWKYEGTAWYGMK